MKVQKRFLRKYKNKDYYKYQINLPSMILKESGIEYGEDLNVRTEKGKIILERKTSKENSKETSKNPEKTLKKVDKNQEEP